MYEGENAVTRQMLKDWDAGLFSRKLTEKQKEALLTGFDEFKESMKDMKPVMRKKAS